MKEERIRPTITNLLQYLTILTPFILIFFSVLSSVINGDFLSGIPILQNLLYIFGGFIIVGFVIILQIIIKNEKIEGSSEICSKLYYPFNYKTDDNYGYNPYINSSILGYTFGYIFIPSIITGNITNYSMLSLFIMLLIINSITELANHCTNLTYLSLGIFLGCLFGLFYNTIIGSINEKLLFLNENINEKTNCKFSNNTFNCKYNTSKYIDNVNANANIGIPKFSRENIIITLQNKLPDMLKAPSYKLNMSFNIPDNINEFGLYVLYNEELYTKYKGDEKGLKLYLEKKANEPAIKNNSPFYLSLEDFYIYIPVINGASLSNIDNQTTHQLIKISIEELDRLNKDIQNNSSRLKLFVKS